MKPIVPKPTLARTKSVEAEVFDLAEILDPWERFLHCVAHNFADADAARRAGLTLAEVKRRKRDDEGFQEAYHQAYDAATDRLESEAARRALLCSDYLLWNMLRGRRRQVYGDKVQVDQRALVITSNLDFDVVKRFDEAVRDITPRTADEKSG